MYLAATLSRAYIPEVNVCDFVHELEELDHRDSLPVSQERWQHLDHASEIDNVYQQLRATFQNGWSENKSEVPKFVLPYYDSRDELTIQGNLIFEGQLLVVPAAVRTELMSVAHTSHISIEGCTRVRLLQQLHWSSSLEHGYVLRVLLPIFARFGLLEVFVTAKGPQFASAEFAVFVKQKGITRVTILTSLAHHITHRAMAKLRMR